jgi:hypothetical protein
MVDDPDAAVPVGSIGVRPAARERYFLILHRNAEKCRPWHFSARPGAVHARAGLQESSPACSIPAGASCPGRQAPNESALAYRGTRLPLQLTEELPAESLGHRNTYFRAHYDAQDRMLCCEKLVYGEVELSHHYEYDAAGRLHRAVITVGDDEPRTLDLPPHGAVP